MIQSVSDVKFIGDTEAYTSVLAATHKRLVSENRFKTIDVSLVRFSGFLRFVGKEIERFGYIVDPQNISVLAAEDGLIKPNLNMPESHDFTDWGDIEQLVAKLTGE